MTRTTRMTALAVAATVAGGLLVTTAAVPAGADIVLGSSIAEVTIGQRPAEVRELKGKPRKVTKRRDSDLGENLKVWQYGKNGRRLDITFYRREVVEVRTVPEAACLPLRHRRRFHQSGDPGEAARGLAMLRPKQER